MTKVFRTAPWKAQPLRLSLGIAINLAGAAVAVHQLLN